MVGTRYFLHLRIGDIFVQLIDRPGRTPAALVSPPTPLRFVSMAARQFPAFAAVRPVLLAQRPSRSVDRMQDEARRSPCIDAIAVIDGKSEISILRAVDAGGNNLGIKSLPRCWENACPSARSWPGNRASLSGRQEISSAPTDFSGSFPFEQSNHCPHRREHAALRSRRRDANTERPLTPDKR